MLVYISFFSNLLLFIVFLPYPNCMARRIIVLEPNFLTGRLVSTSIQSSNTNAPDFILPFEVLQNDQSNLSFTISRGCQANDEDATNAVAFYFFQVAQNNSARDTYLVNLECEGILPIIHKFAEEFGYLVLNSAWRAQRKTLPLVIDYGSVVIDTFYQGLEVFLKRNRLYNMVVVCRSEEDDSRLNALCQSSSRLMPKDITVRRLEIGTNFTGRFDELVKEVHLLARVILLMLPAFEQRHFLVASSKTPLWNGDYVFLCLNLEDETDTVFRPFMPLENEDEAPPLPLFTIRLAIQPEADGTLQLYRQNLTRTLNSSSPLSPIVVRELFMLQNIVHLIDEMQNANSSLNESRTAQLVHLLAGAEPTIVRVFFEKVMPDTSIQAFASFGPTSRPRYIEDFDSSIFESWWPNDNFPPTDLPACVYCPEVPSEHLLLAVIVIPVVMIVLPLAYVYRRRRSSRNNAQNGGTDGGGQSDQAGSNDAWQVKQEELSPFSKTSSKSTISIGSHTSQARHHAPEVMRYKQAVVWVGMRQFTYYYVPDQSQIQYIMKVKSLNAPNLALFYGLLPPSDAKSTLTGIVMEYCTKGSLYDLIAEEQGRFNPALVSVLIKDIVAGMSFIHQSALFCHGSLKSPNCLITSRYNVKITDYYLRAAPLLPPALATDETQYAKMLWTAPEILRGPVIRLRKGTKEGDVYAFGIILQEISMQCEPFQLPDEEQQPKGALSPKDIIHAVIQQREDEPYRPRLLSKYCSFELQQLIKRCWSERPIERPSFKIVSDYVAHIPGFDKGTSYLDYVLQRMEHYQNQLEARVSEATEGLLEEKKKSDDLLAQMLPRSVMEKMQKGEVILPEAFEHATLGFTAVIDFAHIAYASTPLQIVLFLNSLYSMFDNALESYDLYKVETIQDSYVLASGLPTRNGNEHARQVALVAFHMLRDISLVKLPHMNDSDIQMKIGIHTGMVATGVIGQKAPRYCIFGDTVNTTSRMCTTGESQKIQISEATKVFLETHHFGEFTIRPRGTIEVKVIKKTLVTQTAQ